MLDISHRTVVMLVTEGAVDIVIDAVVWVSKVRHRQLR